MFFCFFFKLQAQTIQSLYHERAVLHNQIEKDSLLYKNSTFELLHITNQQTSDQKGLYWVYR